ncbi:probable starch synthase 4, chloroplastic/amyloplastic isoform X2 [Argentina anserina]|uniref:probable starch synthase 4, chloroplastic/amyloplastic isoform X2 n=1 Tax=Argentina anserina TaxID=57926 RepID=UPI0021765C2F|nr:probable starch synthase 4, chloroplastic/amyloplastic isoform X2 [Potentilla anserina]
MAVRLTSWFVSQGISISGSNSNSRFSHSASRFSFASSPASSFSSCKLRHRNLSCTCVQKRPRVRKKSSLGQSSADFQSNGEDESESEAASVPVLNSESVSDDDVQIISSNDSIPTALTTSAPSDLVAMIRNAENNIHLLNQARVSALQDLDKILSEKEGLQGEMNDLEMKLAETDARLRVAAQEKVKMELLGDHLNQMRNEQNFNGGGGGDVERSNGVEVFESESDLFNQEGSLPYKSNINTLVANLSSLRLENVSLRNDIQELREELNSVKNTDERVVMLEKQRSALDSSLKELESKLLVSQEDVSKLSNLKVECKGLWEKVENLQVLLDKSTKQADQAIIVLQQNQEIQEKVNKLEESLEQANVYKESSEKMQHYNELMQQKIKLMEDRLQRSDEEIHAYVKLYQESVEEFQDTLNTLKEESKKRAMDEPVDDMPWEFWSRLLLVIDGWLLERKILVDDAMALRDMVWKRDRRIHDSYMACKEKNVNEAVTTFLRLISSQTSSGLHVVHIAAEMAPIAKVGGLGDVVAGLSKALQKKGHLVEIILPKYDCMEYDRVRDLRALDVAVESYFDGRLYKNKIWVGTVEGLPVYFIEPLHPDKLFWRGQFYGERDDFKRFSFFSRAALELLFQAGKKPDIIHCHDWQTAFVAPLYWDLYAPKGLNSARICFTCHNFEYQGTAPASDLASCGLDVAQLNRPDRMQDNSAHDRINPVKGAVVFSNIVTTVSPTYAQEVRTAEGGRGLHSTLNFHAKKFIGILNGIDADAWNPATDGYLKVQYSANDLEGKAENKEALRKSLGLSSADVRRPLVGCITRLVPQKGVHLIRHAIYRTLELGGQFVLLGSSPVHHIQKEFEAIANHFENHDHIRLILKYDETISHSIFAASDMFIVPSIFEPCGLTQMIAMRYGSIPMARKTGGLNDSVFDVDDDTIPLQFRNGYSFLSPDEQELNGALERAFRHYLSNPESWRQLVQKDMNIDFSWDTSAAQYEELYSKLVARARSKVCP